MCVCAIRILNENLRDTGNARTRCVYVWCSLDMFEYGFHEEWIKTIQWRFVHSRTSPMFVRWNRQKSTRNVCVQLNVILNEHRAHANKEFVCICISRSRCECIRRWNENISNEHRLIWWLVLSVWQVMCGGVRMSMMKTTRHRRKKHRESTQTNNHTNTLTLKKKAIRAHLHHSITYGRLCAHTDSHTIACFYTRTHLHGNPFW